MLSFGKKYIYIFLILIFVIALAAILSFGYNKLISRQNSLFFKITDNLGSPQSFAAGLFLVPTTGNFYIGDTVGISLLVNTGRQSINAVEGKVTFQPDKLEVVAITKTNSIIGLWIQEPILPLNQAGFIAFSGGMPSPGFSGSAGQIMTISFKVKKEGDAVINVESAQVLANDGFGTNLSSEIKASYLTLLKPKEEREISDIDGNGRVDLTDFGIMLTNWGTPKNQKADLNEDDKVDLKDFSILLSRWSPK